MGNKIAFLAETGMNVLLIIIIQTYLLSSATCFSFHNLASDVKDGILIVCMWKETFQGLTAK